MGKECTPEAKIREKKKDVGFKQNFETWNRVASSYR